MKAPLAAAAVAVALGATACAGTGAHAGPGDRARVGTAATVGGAALRSALLAPADLPAGYTADPAPGGGAAGRDGEPAGCAATFDALSTGTTTGSSAAAKAYFKGPQLGTILQERLTSYPDPSAVSAHFGAAADLLASCPRFSLVDGRGVRGDYTVAALAFPALGDATRALALTVETPQFRGAAAIAVVRLGRTLAVFTQGGITADVATLERVAWRGVAKLAAAAR